MASLFRRARPLLTVIMLAGVGAGVLSQLYRVATKLLEEQGFRSTLQVFGRPLNVAALGVLGGAVVVVAVIAVASWWREGADERELRAALERQKRK